MRRGIIADLTCDSDGKIDEFIDLRDVKGFLELHSPNGDEYLIATFLVGAYQEILGDLHNLFGDTDAVHVRLDGDDYRVEHVVEGDSVAEVLSYVQYNKEDLISRVRRSVEAALREKRITTAGVGPLHEAVRGGPRGLHVPLGQRVAPQRGQSAEADALPDTAHAARG